MDSGQISLHSEGSQHTRQSARPVFMKQVSIGTQTFSDGSDNHCDSLPGSQSNAIHEESHDMSYPVQETAHMIHIERTPDEETQQTVPKSM